MNPRIPPPIPPAQVQSGSVRWISGRSYVYVESVDERLRDVGVQTDHFLENIAKNMIGFWSRLRSSASSSREIIKVGSTVHSSGRRLSMFELLIVGGASCRIGESEISIRDAGESLVGFFATLFEVRERGIEAVRVGEKGSLAVCGGGVAI